MEAKFFGYLLVILAIIGLTYGIYYTQEVDDLTREVTALERQADGISRQIQNQQQQLGLRREVAALLGANEAKETEQQALRAEIEALKNEQPAMAEEMAQAVVKVRKASVGMAFPELALGKGDPLKDVRIQRVEEDVVTFQHSLGVTRARRDELPADLRDRLRLEKTALTPKPVAPKPVSAALEESRETPKDLSAHEKKVMEAKLARDRIAKEIPRVKAALDQVDRELETQLSASRKYYTKVRRDQLNAQHLSLQRSFDAADLALQRLEAEHP